MNNLCDKTISILLIPINIFTQPGGAPANKTGTLNTKSVTASMLATDSPILPHKANGSYTQQVALVGIKWEHCFSVFLGRMIPFV